MQVNQQDMNMHFKLTNRTSRALVLLLAALTLAAGTAGRAAEPKGGFGADKFGVTPPPPTPPAPAVATTIDPVTGLPRPAWKDPEWPDPEKRMSELFLDAIPLRQVVEQLQKEFKWAFDVLIPNAWQDPRNPAEVLDPGSTPIKMQLKNVTASEVFNAMNLMFDLENTPYRWELRMNGNRPTAVLRVLPELVTLAAPAPPPPPQTRQVFFVGDLTSDEKPGRMTMEQLVKTVSEVYQMSYGPPKGVLQFHKEAQLLIVTGSGDMIAFAQQTLAALREKARAQEKNNSWPVEPKTNATEPKIR
jgi:hypothetical protein